MRWPETLITSSAAGDPVITVGVAAAAITGEITAGEGGEVGLHEAVVVAVDGSHLAGPTVGDAQVAFGGAGQLAALAVDDQQLDAENGRVAEPGLSAVAPGSGVIKYAGLGCHQVTTIGQRPSPTTL